MASPDAAEQLALLPAPDSNERRVARRCLTALGVFSGLSLLGTAASLYLVNHRPLLLIALSPIGRHLLLVAPTVEPSAFVLVASGRRLASCLACFHLGRALGPGGIVWIEARAAWAGRFVRWVERVFRRFPRSAMLLAPGPTVCALAGISATPAALFAALAGSGLVLRMLLVLLFGEALREPIEALLAWIDRHWIPGTAAILAVIGLQRLWRRRRGAGREPLLPGAP